jgi:hypothetical protein
MQRHAVRCISIAIAIAVGLAGSEEYCRACRRCFARMSEPFRDAARSALERASVLAEENVELRARVQEAETERAEDNRDAVLKARIARLDQENKQLAARLKRRVPEPSRVPTIYRSSVAFLFAAALSYAAGRGTLALSSVAVVLAYVFVICIAAP